MGVDGFGLFGSVGLTISYLNQPNAYGSLVKTLYVHGYAKVALKAFDITLVGLGLDVEYNSGTGEFGLTVDIEIIGIPLWGENSARSILASWTWTTLQRGTERLSQWWKMRCGHPCPRFPNRREEVACLIHQPTLARMRLA